MGEREWGRSEVLRALEGRLPRWVGVSARESAFSPRVDVDLSVPSLRDRLWVREADRAGLLVLAHALLADRPAGTAVAVRWV